MPLSAMPTVYLKLDEASGTRADSTANAYDFSDNNSVGSATGKLNDGANFDGGDWLEKSSNSTLQTGGASWSATVWFKVTSASGFQAIAAKHDGSTAAGSEWLLLVQSTSLKFVTYDGSTDQTLTWSGTLSSGTWYHVVWGYDSATDEKFIAVNGGAKETTSSITSANATSASVTLGATDNAALLYTGVVDEFGFAKNVVWDDDDVDFLYGGGTPPAYEDFASSNVTAGTASVTSYQLTTATVTCTAATGGTSPYTYQWYRDTSPGFTPSGANDVVGATSLTLNDTGLTRGTTYYYQLVATDSAGSPTTDASNEISLTTRNKQLVGDGNSQSVPSGWYGSDSNLGAMLGTTWQIDNEADGSQTTADMVSAYAADVAPYYSASNTANVLVAQEVMNHIYFNATAQQAYDELREYCELGQASGFSVIVLLSQPDRGDFPGTSTLPGANGAAQRAEYQSRYAAFLVLFLADWWEFCDGFVNPFRDSRIVVSSVTYIDSGDLVHWTGTTDTIIASMLTGAIEMVLNPKPDVGSGGGGRQGLHAIEAGAV